MAKKKRRADPARVRELNGGDEAYERHERVQQNILRLIERIDRRIEEKRLAWEAEQAKKAS
jgi:hypothetical protein